MLTDHLSLLVCMAKGHQPLHKSQIARKRGTTGFVCRPYDPNRAFRMGTEEFGS